MMKKTLIYILFSGLPLMGSQHIIAQESSYQQKIDLLDKENKALSFDADLKLSDVEKTLDKNYSSCVKNYLLKLKSKIYHYITVLLIS